MSYEQQVATALRAAADSVVPPVEDLVRGGLERGRRRRRRRHQVWSGITAGVVAISAAAVVVGPRLGSSRPTLPVPSANPSPTGSCAASVMNTALPAWAATGFSDPSAPQPHAVGQRGQIAAVLFGPLSYPESTHVANKVLWVTKVEAQAAPLDIVATLEGAGTVVSRQLPTGPGPSYLELPSRGCWHLALSWNAGKAYDEVDLPFGAPA